jgi:hypothetical protein
VLENEVDHQQERAALIGELPAQALTELGEIEIEGYYGRDAAQYNANEVRRRVRQRWSELGGSARRRAVILERRGHELREQDQVTEARSHFRIASALSEEAQRYHELEAAAARAIRAQTVLATAAESEAQAARRRAEQARALEGLSEVRLGAGH